MAEGAAHSERDSGEADAIAFLGHASVLIELGGVRLLTDPLLRSGVAHLRRQVAPVDQGRIGTPDAVLLSHLHNDHVDLASLKLLGRGTPLIAPRGAGDWLRRRGFSAVTELAAGESTGVGDARVEAVQARHDGKRPGGPRADTLGFVVQGGRSRVYYAGDTELFPELADLACNLDVALLPVAGWGPTLGPGHMNPRQAAQAAALLRPRIAIPVHWGTLLPIGYGRRYRSWLPTPARAFAQHVAELAPEVDVRVLQPGEETQL